MPLIYINHQNDTFRYGIWQNTETDDFFLKKLKLAEAETNELSSLKARKKSEWLCSRYLLMQVADHDIRGACLKDQYGKPYIEGSKDKISISHTFDYTGAIIGQRNCGIDIQVIVPKIIAIAPRFINEKEQNFISENNKLHYFHVIWGAKEAMYKCHGKKELDFRKHIQVNEFEFCSSGMEFFGEIRKDNFNKNYMLHAQLFNDIMIVYANEI